MKRYAAWIAALLVPFTALAMWNSYPLAQALFERGAFDGTHTALVAAVQRFSLLELPFAVLFIVTSRFATALNASRLLMQAGLVALLVNSVASWQFSQWWGIPGLALADSLTKMFALGLLIVLLFRSRSELWPKEAV